MLWGRGIGSPQHLVYEISASLRYIVTMQCPYCDHDSTKVVDTREASEKVRRRRECLECERRFTTYETAQKLDITVKKRNGETQEFDENKIREGVSKAIKKTSIDEEEVDCIVEDVKKSVRGEKEVEAEQIGEAV
ncbi:MAG: ATP cone domain-containing protein, partial [Candidatus Aenigmatarchaeota archaeon]